MVAEELASTHSQAVADGVDLEGLDVAEAEQVVEAGTAGSARGARARSEGVDRLEETLLDGSTEAGRAESGARPCGWGRWDEVREGGEGLEGQSLEVGRVVEVGERAADLSGEVILRAMLIGLGHVWSGPSG